MANWGGGGGDVMVKKKNIFFYLQNKKCVLDLICPNVCHWASINIG
jgi:hypothetical protein